MATIEEYRKQKILAEQLRKREAALGAAIQSGDPTLVTRGSRGATYDMPDIYQANIAGALGKVGGGYLAGRAGGKATEAETATEASRQAALEQVLGGTGMQSGTMTPQQAIQLQELGVEVDVGDFLPKAKTPASAGAILQGVQSGLPPAIVQKLSRGEDLTPDEIMAVQKAQEEKYQREYQDKLNLKRTPSGTTTTPKPLTPEQQKGALTAQWLAATSPEEKAALKAQLDELKGLTAGAKPMSSHEMKAFDDVAKRKTAADEAASRLESMEQIFNAAPEQGGLYSLDQMAANALIDVSSGADGMLPAAVNLFGRAISNEATAAMQSLTTEAVISEMSKLGGNDSEQELRKMRQMYPDGIMPRESALELTRNLKTWRQVTSLANQLELDARADGSYYSAGSERNFYEKAKKQLGVDFSTDYTKAKIPELVKAKRGAAAAPAAAPTGLDPEKQKRLEELRAKKAAGSLQ